MATPTPGVQGGRQTSAQGRQAVGQGKQSGAFEGMDRGGSDTKMQSDRGRTSRGTMTAGRGSGMSGGGGMASHGGGRRR